MSSTFNPVLCLTMAPSGEALVIGMFSTLEDITWQRHIACDNMTGCRVSHSL